VQTCFPQLIDAPPASAGAALSLTTLSCATPGSGRRTCQAKFDANVGMPGHKFRYTPALSIAGHPQMTYCHSHNLVDPNVAGSERRFGIRVTLPPGDTLRTIIGDDWEQRHWYSTEAERDCAFENMATRHGFYRNSDSPTQVLEKISR
jgi:hypothetical protein